MHVFTQFQKDDEAKLLMQSSFRLITVTPTVGK